MNRYKNDFVSIQNCKNRLYVYFSFIHSSNKPKSSSSPRKTITKPSFPILISPKTQPKLPKLPKFNLKPLQIWYPFIIPHQFNESRSIVSTLKEKGISTWVCTFFIASKLQR
jgi:hypothetical protein